MHSKTREKLKLIACYKVLNESDYLFNSLMSVYPHVDRIVIVEGCSKFMKEIAPGSITEEGLSTDGTTKIIENFPDPEDKIIHVKKGLVDASVADGLMNEFWNYLDQGDIMWVIDGDEVWYGWAVQRIKELLLYRRPKVQTIGVNSYVFWHDLEHIIWQDTTGYWNNPGARVCFEVYPGMRFPFHGRIPGGSPPLHQVNVAEPIFHHYAYARPVEKIYIKLKHLIHQYWHEHAGSQNKESFILDDAEYNRETWLWHQVFWTNNYDYVNGVRFKRYSGAYPESMVFPVKHRYFDFLEWNEKPIVKEYALNLCSMRG